MPRTRRQAGARRRVQVIRHHRGKGEIAVSSDKPSRGGDTGGSAIAGQAAARQIGHFGHRLLVWCGALAAALFLIGGCALWRLAQGPVDLDWLSPVVQQFLDRSVDNMQLAISDVRLGLDRKRRRLDLDIAGLHIASSDGEPIAKLPDFSASLGSDRSCLAKWR